MIRKTLVAVGLAGALVFAGSAAAFADYTGSEEIVVTASPASVTPGASSTITATGLDGETATFAVTSGPAGATITSIVYAAALPSTTKNVVDGSASATFTPAAAGNYVVTVTSGEETQSVSVSVGTASAGGGSGSGTLPATGGTVPVEALWLGVGILGLGGIAVTAAVARRRATSNN